MKIGIEASFLTEKNGGELLNAFEDINIDFDHENGYGRKQNDLWLLTYDYSCKDDKHDFGYELISAVYDMNQRSYLFHYITNKFKTENLKTNETCELHINISDDSFGKIFENDRSKLMLVRKIDELYGRIEESDVRHTTFFNMVKSFYHWLLFSHPSHVMNMIETDRKTFIDDMIRILNSFHVNPIMRIPLWLSKKSLVNFEKLNDNTIEIRIRHKNYLSVMKNVFQIVDEFEQLISSMKREDENESYLYLFRALTKATNTKIHFDRNNPEYFIYD